MRKLKKARTKGKICPHQQNGGQNGPAPQQGMQNIVQLLNHRRNFQKKAPPPTTSIPKARFSFVHIVNQTGIPLAAGRGISKRFFIAASETLFVGCLPDFQETDKKFSRAMGGENKGTYDYRDSISSSHKRELASLGMRKSPRGDSVTVPTLGPSGRQERLNCWAKKRR